MTGFFCILILPEEPQAFTAQFPLNRELIEMKLTQVKFAELFSVTARKVSEWEHGKSVPDASIQAKIRNLQKEIANG